MFNIAKQLGWETFWDSVKFTWDSTFVDALGPRDPIEIKPKSNTAVKEMFSMCVWEPLVMTFLSISSANVFKCQLKLILIGTS